MSLYKCQKKLIKGADKALIALKIRSKLIILYKKYLQLRIKQQHRKPIKRKKE